MTWRESKNLRLYRGGCGEHRGATQTSKAIPAIQLVRVEFKRTESPQMIDFTKLKKRNGPTIPTPISEEDGLYLYDPGIWDGTALLVTPVAVTRKFVRCFKRAWNQIPDTDRATLKNYWQAKPSCSENPRIGINLAIVGRYQLAVCRWGHEIDFDVFAVDRLKPTELSHVIAHELGHAISHPHGWYLQHECVAVRGNECVPCECRAFSYMAAWGFDPFFNAFKKKGRTLIERFSKR